MYGELNVFANVNDHIINVEPPWDSQKIKTLISILAVSESER